MKQLNEIYQKLISCNQITTDSRNITPNSIFFALKGDSFNGNLFALEAIKQGASYALVDDPAITGNGILYCDNVLETLQHLANLHRKKNKAKVIGITGTNGKTTTKELIAAVLSKKISIIYTKGNLNNHIGVPLTLLNIKPETEIAIIEMGANHPNEIDFLCNIAEPDFGIITNVGKAHLEGFGSFEGVIKTKTELYRYIINKMGILFINNDNPYLNSYFRQNNDITYGTSSENFVSGKIIESTPYIGIQWTSKKNNTSNKLISKLVGNYNFENLLSAISIGKYFNIDDTLINEAIENYTPTNNRSQWEKTEKNNLLIDAYNANPSSMKVAIENFNSLKLNNKILILGDMFELGEESKTEHQNIVSLINTFSFEKVIFAGKYFKDSDLKPNYFAFENTNDIVEYLKLNPISDAHILIKGSRGMKMEQLIPYL